jgi:archaellum component FlaF (FlaF/FlaG flagellin family)
MGFSNIISQVVLFMSILFTIVVLSIVYKTYITTTNLSVQTQQQNFVDRIDTAFSIISTDYNSSSSEITLELKNKGSTTLKPEDIDIFVDAVRVSREPASRTITIIASTNIVNENLWDSGESVEIVISKNLAAGMHAIKIGVENGVSRSEIIEV